MPDWGPTEGTGHNGRVPVAGLLFDLAQRPTIAAIEACGRNGAFAVTHQDARRGMAELMRDGLGFDCRGLTPGGALHCGPGLQAVALAGAGNLDALAMVTLGPAGHLAGVASLLPVVRMLCGVMVALAAAPGLRAMVWLPARLAVSPAWFAQNVEPWLEGGPFPALALTSLSRSERALQSHGLGFFIGQEFTLSRRNAALREGDMRAAVRLIDWLVAQGRIEAPCEAELLGFGSVFIEPNGQNGLDVTIL